ncbi:MAG: hypothetical protein K0R82_453 [Flavipsychrobacter sp.]|nr:hypothetical protein [Flavipsychrobacter sp.]
MAMAKTKTTWTGESVEDFINALPDERKRADSFRILDMMEQASGHKAEMWGPTIIGFDRYHYKYDSGHEGDAPRVAFSPRKDAITLYLLPAEGKREEMLARLGKHKSSKGCVYIKRLEDIDEKVLKEMIQASLKYLKDLYPAE